MSEPLGTPESPETPESPAPDAPEAPEPQNVDSLPQWARDALKKANAEAAKNRVESRELKEARAAKTELDRIRESQKSEAEKVSERAEQAEKRAQQAERDLMRYRVAADKKVPPEWVDRLRGDTEEEIAADADALMKSLKPANELRPDHSQGSRSSGEPSMNMNTLLRQAAGRT